MTEPWRSLTRKDKIEYDNWITKNIEERWKLGEERYNSHIDGFQGDPLDHAIEETWDELLYLWIAKRRRDYEKEHINDASESRDPTN